MTTKLPSDLFKENNLRTVPTAVLLVAMLLLAAFPVFMAGGADAAVPSEPIGLSGVGGDRQVVLNWTVPVIDGGANITGYSVYRGSVSGNLSSIATLGNVTTYTDLNVTNGLTYWYRVTAVNIDGEGNASNEISVTPVGTAPAPSALTAVPGDSKVGLNWTAPVSNGGANITGYSIYRGPASGGEVLLVTVGNVLSYIDAGVENGVTYWYRVAAVNSYGVGNVSNEASAMPSTFPNEPTGLIATDGVGEIFLSWSAPSNIGGLAVLNYTIYRGTESWNLTHLVIIGPVLNYSDESIQHGTAYYYSVSATNLAGEGPRSVVASSIIITIPSPVLDLTAEARDTEVRLSWTAPDVDGGSPITGYALYRGTILGNEILLVTVGNIAEYADTDVINGLRYYYGIRAINAAGQSPMSEKVSAIPMTTPSAPRNLDAEAEGSTVKLTWSAPLDDGGSAITGYVIYKGTSGNNETKLVQIVNVLTYTDPEITLGETYWYFVTAVNGIWEGVRSNEASIMPIAAAEAPTGFVAVAGDGNVTLNWTAPEEDGGTAITGYAIYRDNGTGAVRIATVEDGFRYVDLDVEDGRSYAYNVRAINNAGFGQVSESLLVTLGGSGPTDDDDAASDWSLWILIGLGATVVLLAVLLVLQMRAGKKGGSEGKKD